MKGAVLTTVLGQGFDLVGGFFIAADVLDLEKLFKSFSQRIESLNENLSNKFNNALSYISNAVATKFIKIFDLLPDGIFLFVVILLVGSRYYQFVAYLSELLSYAIVSVVLIVNFVTLLLLTLKISLDTTSSILA